MPPNSHLLVPSQAFSGACGDECDLLFGFSKTTAIAYILLDAHAINWRELGKRRDIFRWVSGLSVEYEELGLLYI